MDRANEAELLHAMVRIPSVSGSENALAGFLAERLSALGFRTTIDGAGNVRGEVGGPDGPEILLLGHADTVPGGPAVRLADGVLHGRGAVDAKGPLAAMICAAARFARSDLPARIVVIGAVDEERYSAGARYLVDRMRPDAVVIGEPSGASSVGVGYKGNLRFSIGVSVPAAHTSSPAAGAVEVAAGLWATARERFDRWNTLHGGPALFDRALPSLVRVVGDIHEAVAEVSCRLPVGFDADAFLRDLPTGEHRVTVFEHVPAVRSARTDPVVRALSAGIRENGSRPVPKLKLGTADWNVVGPAWGVPVAAYGPGDSRLCHTDQEHIALTEYWAAIDVLASALPRLAASLRQPALAGGPSRTGGTS
ncbi:M20/M25/M40 family metallo-hydrolase [Winogradskya humida]|uniref:Acetyl-lysine deacetylase n=1 Tax=Winogradskya humida TaxID=113566 RepID=A0ABQ4A301_9ACTN|nr:M20/M25/M40 family metallo-hydrolase [Actinoplanes humidus]GIE24998.1 acetyl-lysine deacetylase [Actinoplanes humidus]